jgi:DNA-directed RNA polymerase specialized sigma24 family protein
VELATGGLTEVQLTGLYCRLEKPLYNVVFRRLWSAEESQEVVQEAFLKLLGDARAGQAGNGRPASMENHLE